MAAHADRMIERWGEVMRARRDWCEARGIHFLVVVAPDKQTIYPERLPAVVRDREDLHVLDRAQAVWRAEPAVSVVDLRPELLAAKQYGSLYYRYDTHWTPLGAYLGAARMIEALTDVLPVPAAPPWTRVAHLHQQRVAGDLWRMAGMRGSAPAEDVLVADRPGARARRTDEAVAAPEAQRLKHLAPLVWKGGTGPRMVLFHDSFADWEFQALLAERSDRLVAVGTYHFIEEVVLRERPQVVVCQMVERTLVTITAPRQ
jgi:hypothetical protein